VSHWTDTPIGIMVTSTICNRYPIWVCSLAVNMNNTDEASSLLAIVLADSFLFEQRIF
jgi:hypothetical protein